MGSMLAQEIASGELDLSLRDGILWHLRGNHYPPIPSVMADPCIEAIDAYYEDDTNRMIDMPMVGDFQITYKGSTQAPAWAIIEQHHLSFWLPEEEY